MKMDEIGLKWMKVDETKGKGDFFIYFFLNVLPEH